MSSDLPVPAAEIAAPLGPSEGVVLLDGGDQAYPRMLDAISKAQRSIHLEVYAFAHSGVGALFIDALANAARRGVKVRVVLDGFGSGRGGNTVAAILRRAGCAVHVHNPILALFSGQIGRNHRKILLVDDEVAFLGGINIGDENVGARERLAWADLAVEICGPQCGSLGRRIRRERRQKVDSALRIDLCGLGGGWRLRRQYIKAFGRARDRIHIAHGYFMPDLGVIRAITAAARRGVQVRLLLAGRSDVPFARAATRSLYRELLAAGVSIHEWDGSVLHAKVATVDGKCLLVGSFNLDPFSLANLETLVQITDEKVVAQGEAWIESRFARSTIKTSVEASSRLHRWFLDPIGRLAAQLADAASRLIAARHRRHVRPRNALRSHAGALAKTSLRQAH